MNRFSTYVNFHLAIEPIVEQEIVCHAYAVWLHRMSLAIIIVSNITYKTQFDYLLK